MPSTPAPTTAAATTPPALAFLIRRWVGGLVDCCVGGHRRRRLVRIRCCNELRRLLDLVLLLHLIPGGARDLHVDLLRRRTDGSRKWQAERCQLLTQLGQCHRPRLPLLSAKR